MMKTLTILGCGESLPKDIERYGVVGDVMAVNRSICDYPHPIRHAAMLDFGRYGEAFISVRKAYRRNLDFTMHMFAPAVVFGEVNCEWVSHRNHPDIKMITMWPMPVETQRKLKNTSLFGAIVGRLLGYDDIRLLGCNGSGGHYYDIIQENQICKSLNWLKDNKDLFSGVRSAGGITAEILGNLQR